MDLPYCTRPPMNMGDGDGVSLRVKDDGDSVSHKPGSRNVSRGVLRAIDPRDVRSPQSTVSEAGSIHKRDPVSVNRRIGNNTPDNNKTSLLHRGWNPEPVSSTDDTTELTYAERSELILQTLRNEGILFGEPTARKNTAHQHENSANSIASRPALATRRNDPPAVCASRSFDAMKSKPPQQTRNPATAYRDQLPNVVDCDRETEVRRQRFFAKMEENRQMVVDKYLARTEKLNSGSAVAREKKTKNTFDESRKRTSLSQHAQQQPVDENTAQPSAKVWPKIK